MINIEDNSLYRIEKHEIIFFLFFLCLYKLQSVRKPTMIYLMSLSIKHLHKTIHTKKRGCICFYIDADDFPRAIFNPFRPI